VIISAVIVAFQHQDTLQALAGPEAGHVPLIKALSALAGA
jgi:hypothetical protein